jgi:hypothetical protein
MPVSDHQAQVEELEGKLAESREQTKAAAELELCRRLLTPGGPIAAATNAIRDQGLSDDTEQACELAYAILGPAVWSAVPHLDLDSFLAGEDELRPSRDDEAEALARQRYTCRHPHWDELPPEEQVAKIEAARRDLRAGQQTDPGGDEDWPGLVVAAKEALARFDSHGDYEAPVAALRRIIQTLPGPSDEVNQIAIANRTAAHWKRRAESADRSRRAALELKGASDG